MKPSNFVFDQSIQNKLKFGKFLTYARESKRYTIRDFAKLINISSTYLHDIENGKRPFPLHLTSKLIEVLQIPEDELIYFVDLIGSSHSNWNDINEYINQNPHAREFLRIAKSKNIPDDQLAKIILNAINKTSEKDEKQPII